MDKKGLIKIRDTFREGADIIDEMLELEEKQSNGEDVKKELEGAMGRFFLNALTLQSLQ